MWKSSSIYLADMYLSTDRQSRSGKSLTWGCGISLMLVVRRSNADVEVICFASLSFVKIRRHEYHNPSKRCRYLAGLPFSQALVEMPEVGYWKLHLPHRGLLCAASGVVDPYSASLESTMLVYPVWDRAFCFLIACLLHS